MTGVFSDQTAGGDLYSALYTALAGRILLFHGTHSFRVIHKFGFVDQNTETQFIVSPFGHL